MNIRRHSRDACILLTVRWSLWGLGSSYLGEWHRSATGMGGILVLPSALRGYLFHLKLPALECRHVFALSVNLSPGLSEHSKAWFLVVSGTWRKRSHHCLRCLTGRSARLSFVLPKHERVQTTIGVIFLFTVTMYLTHSILIEEVVTLVHGGCSLTS